MRLDFLLTENFAHRALDEIAEAQCPAAAP
jgi:hypothetical protein